MSFAQPYQQPGLQLWSLREQTKVDLFTALDLAASYGFTAVETAGTGNLTVAQFSKELSARGLNAVSAHMSYERLRKDLGTVIADALALGVEFVVCPWLPHRATGFDETAAHSVAAEFNHIGSACRAAGLRFGYHPHGFEFTPAAAGNGMTVFDVLVSETNPALVDFELDPFWVRHAGEDTVKLIEKYPARWALMHVKDMRRGAAIGFSTGRAAVADNVAVGTGQIDWPRIFDSAEKSGMKYYFIEDETLSPHQCIPTSLAFLRDLALSR